MGSRDSAVLSKTQGSADGGGPRRSGRRRAATSCAPCSPAERRGFIDPARPSSLVFHPYLHPRSRPPSFLIGIFNCPRNCHLTFHGYACISCRERWAERKELRLISNSSRPTSSFPSHLKQNKTKKDINSRISPYFSTEKSAQVTPFGKFHAGFGVVVGVLCVCMCTCARWKWGCWKIPVLTIVLRFRLLCFMDKLDEAFCFFVRYSSEAGE